MKKDPKEALLHDVLKEASAGFRKEILEKSLAEFRQRRAKRKTWLGAPWAIAAGFVLGIGLLFFGLGHRFGSERRVARSGDGVSAPVLSFATMEIVTNTGPGIVIVESLQYRSHIVGNSSVGQGVEILGDAELLALFPNEPAGLIANSQGNIQLVFLDSKNRSSHE